MNKERLLKLADHLENVVALMPGAFDMNSFGSKTPCGTKCCALGHACSIPDFAADGLAMEWEWDDDPNAGVGVVCLERDGDQESLYHFEAAEAFFDLDEEQAGQIFGADDEDRFGRKLTPTDVAAMIREMVASA